MKLSILFSVAVALCPLAYSQDTLLSAGNNTTSYIIKINPKYDAEKNPKADPILFEIKNSLKFGELAINSTFTDSQKSMSINFQGLNYTIGGDKYTRSLAVGSTKIVQEHTNSSDKTLLQFKDGSNSAVYEMVEAGRNHQETLAIKTNNFSMTDTVKNDVRVQSMAITNGTQSAEVNIVNSPNISSESYAYKNPKENLFAGYNESSNGLSELKIITKQGSFTRNTNPIGQYYTLATPQYNLRYYLKDSPRIEYTYGPLSVYQENGDAGITLRKNIGNMIMSVNEWTDPFNSKKTVSQYRLELPSNTGLEISYDNQNYIAGIGIKGTDYAFSYNTKFINGLYNTKKGGMNLNTGFRYDLINDIYSYYGQLTYKELNLSMFNSPWEPKKNHFQLNYSIKF